MIGGSIYHIHSKKQRIVTNSSTFAELNSLCTTVEELLWAKETLDEIGIPQETIVVQQDNKSTIRMVERGPGRYSRARHINARHYFVKQYLDSGVLKLNYIPSKELIADGLTKALPPTEFRKWRMKLLNINSTSGNEN